MIWYNTSELWRGANDFFGLDEMKKLPLGGFSKNYGLDKTNYYMLVFFLKSVIVSNAWRMVLKS